MPQIELATPTGAPWQYFYAMWGPIYEARFANFGATTTICPMGDPFHGLPNASTFTGRKSNASGLSPTWTPSTALTAWATAYALNSPSSLLGPAGIPKIAFDGSNNYVETPDAAYWTSALTSFTVVFWANVTDTAARRVLIGKYNGTTGSTAREFDLFIESDDTFFGLVYDNTGDTYIARSTSGATTQGSWAHFVMTYNGGTTNAAIKLYVNGANVDNTNSGSGVFVSMRDTSAVVDIGCDRSPASGAPATFFSGAMAGGPLGPLFVQVAATAAQIDNDYALGRHALGLV